LTISPTVLKLFLWGIALGLLAATIPCGVAEDAYYTVIGGRVGSAPFTAVVGGRGEYYDFFIDAVLNFTVLVRIRLIEAEGKRDHIHFPLCSRMFYGLFFISYSFRRQRLRRFVPL
jgi:hypothetical protein